MRFCFASASAACHIIWLSRAYLLQVNLGLLVFFFSIWHHNGTSVIRNHKWMLTNGEAPFCLFDSAHCTRRTLNAIVGGPMRAQHTHTESTEMMRRPPRMFEQILHAKQKGTMTMIAQCTCTGYKLFVTCSFCSFFLFLFIIRFVFIFCVCSALPFIG